MYGAAYLCTEASPEVLAQVTAAVFLHDGVGAILARRAAWPQGVGQRHAGHDVGGRVVVGVRQRLTTGSVSRHGHLAAQAVDEALEVVETAQQLLIAAAVLFALGALGGEDAFDAGAAAGRARLGFVAADLGSSAPGRGRRRQRREGLSGTPCGCDTWCS